MRYDDGQKNLSRVQKSDSDFNSFDWTWNTKLIDFHSVQLFYLFSTFPSRAPFSFIFKWESSHVKKSYKSYKLKMRFSFLGEKKSLLFDNFYAEKKFSYLFSFSSLNDDKLKTFPRDLQVSVEV